MHTSVRLYPDKFSLRFFGMNAGLAGLLLAILLVGCTKQELPDLGPRLSQTAALELSPSLLEFKGEYTDNCGHLQIVQMGSTLQDMLFEAANRTFASVVRPGSNVKPDVVVRVNLVQSNFTLRWDGVYDRAQTDLQLGGLVSFVDQAGSALGEQEVQVVQKGRVRIEPLQKNCDYLLDDFIQGAAREFAQKVSDASRRKFAPTSASATPAGAPVAAASRAAAAPAAIPVPVPAPGRSARTRRNGAFI